MEIIPAIDFKDGKVVNLKQGQLDQSTIYSDDPVGMAEYWVSKGCERLHLVDLDGAFDGRPKNANAINIIAKNHPNLTIQLGGGIRSAEVIESYLNAGVDYLIIGTKAVQEPEFVGEMCKRFPGHIIVGLDGLHGMVAINGWKEVTDISVKSLARLFEGDGIDGIVYTDIGKDGMMGLTWMRQRICPIRLMCRLLLPAVLIISRIFSNCLRLAHNRRVVLLVSSPDAQSMRVRWTWKRRSLSVRVSRLIIEALIARELSLCEPQFQYF